MLFNEATTVMSAFSAKTIIGSSWSFAGEHRRVVLDLLSQPQRKGFPAGMHEQSTPLHWFAVHANNNDYH